MMKSFSWRPRCCRDPTGGTRGPIEVAGRLGLLHVEERRVSAFRNLPNKLTITSREWLLWLRMRRRGVGANPRTPRLQENNKGTSAQRSRGQAAEGQGTEALWTDEIAHAAPFGR